MIIDGKIEKQILLDKLKGIIGNNKLRIKLAIIQVGNEPSSIVYIKNKEKACKYVGIDVETFRFDESVKEIEVCKLINELNLNDEITGIILQSPVPSNIDYDKCVNLISSNKDVDGFTKENIYNLYLNRNTILPCTIKGIIYLLEKYNIELSGSNVVIVGRGKIVGKPLALALTNKDATVTLVHSKTKNLKNITNKADILISATGVPELIKENMVKENAIVIDVGISYIDDKIVGDVCFSEVAKKAKYITPSPGGVGPMTVAMIIDNLVEMKLGR